MSRATSKSPPIVVVIAGPNGAGKTTIAKRVLADTLGITEFVNADAIAIGLSGFSPERAAIAAGRVMLTRLRELADAGESFAFESTLASRSFAPWLRELIVRGYELYVSLASPAQAIRRVKARVRRGGHHVPNDIVRRRFERSARNLVELYLPIAATWRIFDNSTTSLGMIAERCSPSQVRIVDRARLIRLLHAAKLTLSVEEAFALGRDPR
jgi:predicted ABC-type ATPase